MKQDVSVLVMVVLLPEQWLKNKRSWNIDLAAVLSEKGNDSVTQRREGCLVLSLFIVVRNRYMAQVLAVSLHYTDK